MYYYIKDTDNKVVLVDQNRQKLENTLKFMPQYAECEIRESNEPIELYRPPLTAQEEVARLRAYLASTDYVTNKIVESGLPLAEFLAAEGNAKYADILAQREATRTKISKLNE